MTALLDNAANLFNGLFPIFVIIGLASLILAAIQVPINKWLEKHEEQDLASLDELVKEKAKRQLVTLGDDGEIDPVEESDIENYRVMD